MDIETANLIKKFLDFIDTKPDKETAIKFFESLSLPEYDQLINIFSNNDLGEIDPLTKQNLLSTLQELKDIIKNR